LLVQTYKVPNLVGNGLTTTKEAFMMIKLEEITALEATPCGDTRILLWNGSSIYVNHNIEMTVLADNGQGYLLLESPGDTDAN
jgi:hypothetical protein